MKVILFGYCIGICICMVIILPLMQATLQDGEVQCVEGDSCRIFQRCEEGIYRNV